MAGERGSDKLFQERLRTKPLTEQDLKQTIDLLRQVGEIGDCFPLGKPDPEVLYATVRVERDRLPVLVKGLIDLEAVRIRRLDSFPFGTPVINEFLVQLGVSGQLEG